MKQQPVDKSIFPAMPVVLVGTVVDGKENFMAVGWCSRVNSKPPMIAVAISKTHHTPKGILPHETFSICFPDSSMVKVTDYCGIVSGKNEDKSKLFSTFSGMLENAPMIEECPLNMECKLIQTVELPGDYLFIAEIIGTYAREDVIVDGKPVMEKLDPMILTMPDNRYWKLETCVGHAWKDGLTNKRE
jgi:flavin reductase (DIM6/NTAB) family NADH-FMN oxidoreductase RutF